MARIGECFPQGLRPDSISVASTELLGELRISGRVAPDPVGAFRSLEQLRLRLEALPELEHVEVEPDGTLGRNQDGARAGLGFDLHAHMVKQAP